MKCYVSLQPLLIPLLRLIKRWARSVGMNSPSKRPASFNSYTLTLMTIAWFQVRSLIRSSSSSQLSITKSLGWLPNLQDNLSTKNNISPTTYFWIKNKKGERFRCDTRFKIVENWPIHTERPVGELFFEWLEYGALRLLFLTAVN